MKKQFEDTKRGVTARPVVNGLYSRCQSCGSGWLAEIQYDGSQTWRPKLLLFCEHLSHVHVFNRKPYFVKKSDLSEILT